MNQLSRIADDPRFQQILVECLEAIEAGGQAEPAHWIARYPEYAEPLREFFASRSMVDSPGGDAPTLPPSGDRGIDGPSVDGPVRYFGDYELIAEIARGGMGVVYRARQKSLNRVVALKMILSGEFASSEDVARFRAEAEAAANLDHPAIVPIYEIGEHQGRHYFSMKYVAGESLAACIRREAASKLTQPAKRSELEEAVALVTGIARAVHYAHQRGIIHRDLKPANVLIDESGRPHVTDFGLAKRLAAERELTQSGAILGTPEFMAPEQTTGRPSQVTTAADIYGLGGILYAMLTHRPPFVGASPLETLLQVVEQPPAAPGKLRRGIDAELETICLKCLDKDPEQRYRSAGELADDLERWRRGEPIAAAPPSLARLLWRWFAANYRAAAWVVAIGALCGLAVSVPPVTMTAQNLEPYLTIYETSFSEVEPPWLLRAVTGVPWRWLALLLPLLLLLYFGMGFMIDRLVRPADTAAAIGIGLGMGLMAATTAYFTGIGWTSLIQSAVWPSESDLEALANTADQALALPDQKFIHEAYPNLRYNAPYGQGRQLMKKTFADIQSRLPPAMWTGFLFAAGLLVAPATVQTLMAWKLRQRGDGRVKAAVHYSELALPVSLAMLIWSEVCWREPLAAAAIMLAPIAALVAFARSNRLSAPFRCVAISVIVAAAAGVVVWLLPTLFPERDMAFSRRTNPGFGLAALGAVAAALAVLQRWKWWVRLPVYALWFGLWAADSRDIRGGDPRLVDGLVIAGCGLMALTIATAAYFHWTTLDPTARRASAACR